MGKTIRLSQCMIVKNEEDNIRRALTWGQGLVCEQIVVDTGSEDNTVAIAEEMGAKVFHYQWQNDFSAAKNFALSKATGDWIAFFDADEYCLEEDRGKIRDLMQFLAAYPVAQQPDTVRCNMLHLDGQGNVFSTTTQDRFIKNSSKLRYQNRIHEKLTCTTGRKLVIHDIGDAIPIYHTGYAFEESKKKGKSERNLAMLMREAKEHPEEYGVWSYIGDSRMAGRDDAGALEAYRKVIDHPEAEMDVSLRLNAFANAMRLLGMDTSTSEAEVQELYARYEGIGAIHPDMEYWMGLCCIRFGKNKEGIAHLEKALSEMEAGEFPFTIYISGELPNVYRTLTLVCAQEKDAARAVRYAVLALRADRYQDDVLNTLLKLFVDNGEAAAGVYGFLSKIYDFGSSRDVFFVYKAAKLMRFYGLEDYVYHTLSESEIAFLEEKKEGPFRLSGQQAQERYPLVSCRNETDMHFLELAEEIRRGDAVSMVLQMTNAIREREKKDKASYDETLRFYEEHPYWGSLHPEKEDYDTFWQRSRVLQDFRERAVSLYAGLADYRSKRVLCALLESWMHLETAPLQAVKDHSLQIFDPDLMPDACEKQFVDIWATEGNDVRNFRQAYGDVYGQVTCYVRSEEDALKLSCNLRGMKRLQILVRTQEALDMGKDIPAPVDFLRLHGEGREVRLLECCSKQIAKDKPSLIVSAYYGYGSIFELAEKILELNPSYRLYLRYFGDMLAASDYYLIAI